MHLICEDFSLRILNRFTLNPEWITMFLRKDALSTDEQSSPLANRASPHSTQSRPQLPPQNCEICSSFVFLGRSNFPLDPFQDKTHSFPWLAMSSWKLSNESRCSNSDTYFLTQTFITASHPKLMHYLLRNSQSLKPTERSVRLFLWAPLL